jgi:hypothetical protein
MPLDEPLIGRLAQLGSFSRAAVRSWTEAPQDLRQALRGKLGDVALLGNDGG